MDKPERARTTPEALDAEGERSENTLKRVSLALLHELAADTRERGSDPYNTTDGRTRPDLWSKQRGRR